MMVDTAPLLQLCLALGVQISGCGSCGCQSVEVASTGAALDHAPAYLGQLQPRNNTAVACNLPSPTAGVFHRAGELSVGAQQADYFQSATGKVLTIDIFSPPFKWTVADSVGSFNAAIMNRSLGKYCNISADSSVTPGGTQTTPAPTSSLILGSTSSVVSGAWMILFLYDALIITITTSTFNTAL